jgi:hypothetical protein
VNGFIDHLNTQLRSTSNYSTTVNLHNSQITTASTKLFSACCVFISCSLATASNVEILQLHVLRFDLHRLPCRTLANYQMTVIQSPSPSQSYFTAGGLLPISSSCSQAPWDPCPEIFFFLLNPTSQDSVVGIVTSYGLDDWEFFLLNIVQTGSWVNPTSYPMGTGGSFPAGKAAGAWSWPLTSS